MATVLEISEELWRRLAPLLPPESARPKGGRPPLPNRKILVGIVFMLLTGCPWRLLPAKALGCGSATTCWRRVRDWQQAGAWEHLHQTLLVELRLAGKVDVSPTSLDAFGVDATKGHPHRNQPGRQRPASKHAAPTG